MYSATMMQVIVTVPPPPGVVGSFHPDYYLPAYIPKMDEMQMQGPPAPVYGLYAPPPGAPPPQNYAPPPGAPPSAAHVEVPYDMAKVDGPGGGRV